MLGWPYAKIDSHDDAVHAVPWHVYLLKSRKKQPSATYNSQLHDNFVDIYYVLRLLHLCAHCVLMRFALVCLYSLFKVESKNTF